MNILSIPVDFWHSQYMQYITVTDDTGKSVRMELTPHDASLSLAQCIYTHGAFAAPALCAGLGRCGRCRVRFTSPPPLPKGEDAMYFSEAELRAGWRLACRHAPETGMELLLPPTVATSSTLPPLPDIDAGTALSLAIDLGTTSLHWSLLADNRRIAAGQELNPQMGAGSEVMSRLAYAATPHGAAQLQGLVLRRIHDLIRTAEDTTGCPVQECCIAGNSVMTALLLGKSTSGLATAPYRLEFHGGTTETVEGLPPVYIPPLPAPFVGGDLSAGVCTVQQDYPDYPYLLADLGTNGEFILGLAPDKALITSVALGPALEGIGLTFGTVAQPGVLTGFRLTPGGVVPELFSDTTQTAQQPPHGISGTGYLALVHSLLKAGLIGEDGRFAHPPYAPLAARLAANMNEHCGERRFMITDSLWLSATDVEELLKVKAAFTLAFERLLSEAALAPSALAHIHIAGSLGEHIDPAVLEGLGFIPAGTSARVRGAGNTSLCGAELFLVDPALRTVAERWSANAVTVDLTTDPAFTQNFIRHMRFTYS